MTIANQISEIKRRLAQIERYLASTNDGEPEKRQQMSIEHMELEDKLFRLEDRRDQELADTKRN